MFILSAPDEVKRNPVKFEGAAPHRKFALVGQVAFSLSGGADERLFGPFPDVAANCRALRGRT